VVSAELVRLAPFCLGPSSREDYLLFVLNRFLNTNTYGRDWEAEGDRPDERRGRVTACRGRRRALFTPPLSPFELLG